MFESLPAVGSPADVATLLVVLVAWRGQVEPRLDVLGAGVVALARGRPDVDEDRLRADLEVDPRDVDAVTRATTDGGDDER